MSFTTTQPYFSESRQYTPTISGLDFRPEPYLAEVDILQDATLRQIDEVINQDVEMQPLNVREIFYLVVDTNVLLHYLDALQQFVIDIEHHLRMTLQIVVPGIVVSELDRQKTRNDKVAWAARVASTWLLEKVKERRFVKGQAHEETCKASRKWNVRDAGEIKKGGSEWNDDLILDCCQYFARPPPHGWEPRYVALCSGDKNLCLKVESVGIRTLSPSNGWTSRAIATALFAGAPNVDLGAFDGQVSKVQRRTLRFPGTSAGRPLARVNASVGADAMDIDEEPIGPSHPLDMLHLELIDHFSQLLLQVVDRVGGPEVPWHEVPTGRISQHAPGWTRVKFSEWRPRESIEYLGRKGGEGLSRGNLDRLVHFLEYPDKRGGRKGQDWTRSDWESGVSTLGAIGRSWEDDGLAESVEVLKRYAGATFLQRMRPTGM
ncbi:PIN domain-containing protein [Gloeopeniophorella convolvens]|nr:PIN domain-containing protein [Gloeopeniophorella convolvens]